MTKIIIKPKDQLKDININDVSSMESFINYFLDKRVENFERVSDDKVNEIIAEIREYLKRQDEPDLITFFNEFDIAKLEEKKELFLQDVEQRIQQHFNDLRK